MSSDTTTETTATLREQARAAEHELRWTDAAALLRKAIEVYPARFRSNASGQRDIELMAARAAAHENHAKALASIEAHAKLFPVHFPVQCMTCRGVCGRSTVEGSTGLCDACLAVRS